jgi:hypothetical protein
MEEQQATYRPESPPRGLPADQTELLTARYELVYLIFQFLISLAVLVGVFLLIVVFQEGAIASGGVALAAIVVSYWFGISAKRLH